MTEKQFRSRTLNWTKALLYSSLIHVGSAVEWLNKHEQGIHGKYSEHYIVMKEIHSRLAVAIEKFKEIK